MNKNTFFSCVLLLFIQQVQKGIQVLVLVLLDLRGYLGHVEKLVGLDFKVINCLFNLKQWFYMLLCEVDLLILINKITEVKEQKVFGFNLKYIYCR